MPNLLATASQVANSLSNLKAKYIKYLETLCSANGIDISTLKTEGDSHKTLEMFFGGLPVLVGLKYFSHLSVLRLFGQQITCLKPLGEVAPTLEELWICEGGVVKDLNGVDHCVRLKKLFLYENSIEDASCLSSLTSLQHLNLASNKLQNLAFLSALKDLTLLSLADNKMRDSVISTAVWPENIQHLDVSYNCFSSNKVLFPITILSSLRSLHVDPITCTSNVAPNLFYTWIAHSFRFIESIDDDPITESFVPTFRPMVDTIMAENMAKLAKVDEKYYKDIRLVEKHSGKIENRLACLAEALTAYRDLMQTKDAKKEIVKRVHEICVNNSKAVKHVKKNFTVLAEYIRCMSKYRIATEMESCKTFQLRDGTTEEIGFITQTLNYNCSMKNSYSIIIKSCSMIGEITKNESDRLLILEKDSNEKPFDERSIFRLLDRFTRNDYIKHGVRLMRDFEVIKKQAKEKTTIFFIPLVLSKSAALRGTSNFIDEEGMSSSDSLGWSNVTLITVLAVEIQPIGQLTTDQLRHMDQFEESYNEQLKKLNEMNIKLDIKEERRKRSEDGPETSLEAINNQQSKVRKVSDVLSNVTNLNGRACDEKLPFDWFTIRNPLEVSLAYFDFKQIKEINEIAMRMTVLDLSDQKLTKLAGIQNLCSLNFLSLRKNKLVSLKKLNRLPSLKFLDASYNHLGKIEQLPSSLLHVELSNNRLQHLTFCQFFANVRHLRVYRNQVKSLKGLEMCVQLESLFLNENSLKDRNELEILKVMPKLTHLDLAGNPMSTSEGYRSKVMQAAQFLISLDRQIIPLEERHVNTMKLTTRGLSLELIERICPEWKNKKELMICDQKIEQIIVEKAQMEELSHIRLIDLSRNKLSSVREISPLNITHLILNNNCLKSVAVTDTLQPFQLLENLDISYNSINNTTILRLGIPLLLKLKCINLSSNFLSRFDCSLFDIPNLESIDLSNNSIKTIVRRPLRSLTSLNLQNNRLTTLSPLSCQNLNTLNVSNNKLASCASLKPLCECKSLEILDCRNNSVTERRVYVDFIKAQVPSVKKLDEEEMNSEVDVTKRRLSRANDLMSLSRRSSMVTSSMLSWFEKEEGEVLENVRKVSNFLEPTSLEVPLRPRRLEPLPGRRKEQDTFGFMLLGTKAIQHRK